MSAALEDERDPLPVAVMRGHVDTIEFESSQAAGLSALADLIAGQSVDVTEQIDAIRSAAPGTTGRHRKDRALGHRRRIVIFAVIGIVTFAAGAALQWALVRRVGADASYIWQAIFSIELSYALNRWLTWRDRAVPVLMSLARWNVQKAILYVPNLLVYDALIHVGAGWLTANVVVSAAFAAVNYVTGDLWSFATRAGFRRGATAQRTDASRAAHGLASRMPDVRHRFLVVTAMILTIGSLYAIERRLWPTSPVLPGDLERVWSWLSLLWLAPAIPATFEFAGLLIYRHPRRFADDGPIPHLVCWRIVSRGLNAEALTAAILRCRAESQALPLFPYIIEVITDTSHGGLPAPAHDLRYIRVPRHYETPGGTHSKARALHYALQESPLPGNAWIVHLDEESQPTPSGVRGIARMIAEEEANGRLRIGQGAITYHRNLEDRPFFTLADCIRTGSDLGRLFLSMRIGVPLFGLHGSFIVVRNDVEKEVGFDVGPAGSITEDAWWGYQQMEGGRRCRWVDGIIEEQCTHSAGDFLAQRRRWFSGLVNVALRAPVRLRWRVMLGVSMATWAVAPLAWLYTIEHFVHGGHVATTVQAVANFSLAVYVVTTLVGLRVNLAEHGGVSQLRRIGWSLTWLTCLPMFSLMESAGVAWALARPARRFHVVKK